MLSAALLSIASCAPSGGPAQPGAEDEPAATGPASGRIDPPPSDAERPAAYPGLGNVVTYAEGLVCGAQPAGEAGFATLKAMGIATVISVDGAAPDVETARRYGLRYVHLPIGYDGMDRARALQITRAVQAMPGPVYIHCHHGRHRSACAAGAAAVTLGLLTREQALARMHVSGTSPSYPGLFRAVAEASADDGDALNALSTDFPEVWPATSLVQTMVRVEAAHAHLAAIAAAGWRVPAEHPDLVPASEAGQLADLFRALVDLEQVQGEPDDFRRRLREASSRASRLEAALIRRDGPGQLTALLEPIQASCRDCHRRYRN